MSTKRSACALAAGLLLVITASCNKSASSPPIPPPPAPMAAAKPSIDFFSAEPATVSAGQAAAIRWAVRDATRVQIDNGIGEVEPNGSRPVHPTNITTMYKLEATNPAGTSTAVLTINISGQAPGADGSSSNVAGQATESRVPVLSTQLRDLHFSYDKEEILPEDKELLDNDIRVLQSLFAADPKLIVTIEGHCDERGSSEYNIGLGDRRAGYVKSLLVRSGLPEDKLNALSFGKEQPACLEPTEGCYARNRRAHFSPSR